MRATSLITLATVVAALGQVPGCVTAGERAIPREATEWCNVWVPNADKNDLPRALFIGDSIAQGYFDSVQTCLAGKAYCARITTSKCIGDPGLLPEVELLLRQYRFSVIHVNNGLHGFFYSEEQYGRAFEPFMKAIMRQGGDARLIWASTTPVMTNGNPANERTERVKARNQIAAGFASRHRIPVNELFGLVVNHPEYYSADGVHLNKMGIEAQARQVADYVVRSLDGK